MHLLFRETGPAAGMGRYRWKRTSQLQSLYLYRHSVELMNNTFCRCQLIETVRRSSFRTLIHFIRTNQAIYACEYKLSGCGVVQNMFVYEIRRLVEINLRFLPHEFSRFRMNFISILGAREDATCCLFILLVLFSCFRAAKSKPADLNWKIHNI